MNGQMTLELKSIFQAASLLWVIFYGQGSIFAAFEVVNLTFISNIQCCSLIQHYEGFFFSTPYPVIVIPHLLPDSIRQISRYLSD